MKITRTLTFGAAGTQFNVLAGTNLQYAPFTGTLKLGASLSASTGTLNAFAGSDQVVDTATIPPNNRVPILPDDYMLLDETIIAQGEQIKIDVTAAGAASCFLAVELTPLE